MFNVLLIIVGPDIVVAPVEPATVNTLELLPFTILNVGALVKFTSTLNAALDAPKLKCPVGAVNN